MGEVTGCVDIAIADRSIALLLVGDPTLQTLSRLPLRPSMWACAEHKSYPSPAGNPALRSDASPCDPRYTDMDALTRALREAITRGCIGAIFEGGFPKYVWGWMDGRLYEAGHINGPQGTYKAYMLEELERPKDDERRLMWEEHDA